MPPPEFLKQFQSLQPPRLKEKSKGVMFQPGNKKDEEIYLYKSDDPDFRKKLGLSDRHCCDGLLFYRHGQETSLLVLIELKGRKQSESAAQFLDLYNALQPLMGHAGLRWYALLVTKTASLQDQKAITRQLNAVGLKALFAAGHGSNCNLRTDTKLPLCTCEQGS